MNKKLIFIIFLIINEVTPIEKNYIRPSSDNTLYNEYTESIANDVNYYILFRKLQAKASNHLRKLNRAIREYIQDLNFNYKYHQATSYRYELNIMLKNLENKFMDLFQAADESFLLVANILDENDNTHQEKMKFIIHAKKDLQLAIDKLIKESNHRFINAFN